MSEDTPTEPPAQQQREKQEASPASHPEGDKAAEPQTQEEEVKSKPTPAPASAPAPEFDVVKQGFIQRQGHLWKNWYRQWMTLDEGGVALRWYKTEQRTGNDGTLYMSKCAEVCEPKEGLTTNWPPEVEGRCFVVCSPNRAHYIIAESEDDKKDWIEKLTAAKTKFNTTGVGIVSVNLISVEAIKVTMEAEVQRAQGETDRALAGQGTSTEKIGKDLDKAAQDMEKEVKKETTTQQETQVREEPFGCKIEVGGETEVKIEAGGGEVMEEKTETVKEEEEVKTEVMVESGEVVAEVQVTSEEVVAEVQVTSEEVVAEVQVTSEEVVAEVQLTSEEVVAEEQKKEQPPAAEDAAKEE
ncbi:hypothetical protein GBAR_LOCUS22546 [Geodia barretti]|uniref:PH domain-containing protein n=1 Tax=Geodia barretti TaxID=519541 RepID=A0AA35T3A9_GEOBA|nr:hypothetical protein GBAR_LOCUS22546 [Geodia barretti]